MRDYRCFVSESLPEWANPHPYSPYTLILFLGLILIHFLRRNKTGIVHIKGPMIQTPLSMRMQERLGDVSLESPDILSELLIRKCRVVKGLHKLSS